MLTTLVLFVGGGILLVGGAELLVRGASRIAAGLGISPLVVGLTVVAFGTSAPEFAVSIGSSLAGNADVALGNVVGSNIFNILFILGIAALFAPLVVERQLVRFDLPVALGASLLVGLMALDGEIGALDGALLMTGLVVYVTTLIRMGSGPATAGAATESNDPPAGVGPDPDPPRPGGSRTTDVFVALVGLALLVLGSRWFVGAAVTTAERLGVSELVIGLTVVAAGTSLPEVATSVLASLRGQRDIAVGNVIGSNVFNLLGVLGAGALAAPGGMAVSTGALTFDIPLMIAVTLVAVPILYSGWIVSRWEGALFLLWYVAYTSWLVFDATAHPGEDELTLALLGFALPFTVMLLLVSGVRNLKD
ncbi:MAG TPA: calcium/sodium antiporter [Longimicrobiales bacterium]|nr:calcium/sodium antiporter [Longimicrobiales bacterium]